MSYLRVYIQWLKEAEQRNMNEVSESLSRYRVEQDVCVAIEKETNVGSGGLRNTYTAEHELMQVQGQENRRENETSMKREIDRSSYGDRRYKWKDRCFGQYNYKHYLYEYECGSNVDNTRLEGKIGNSIKPSRE